MCQLIVENGGDPELAQFGGHAFVSCDSIAPLFQVLRIQVRALTVALAVPLPLPVSHLDLLCVRPTRHFV